MKKYWKLMVVSVLIIALLAVIGWQFKELHTPRTSYIACFEGYQLGVKIGDELVPMAFTAGESIDPNGLPMVAIYGTYCTDVYK